MRLRRLPQPRRLAAALAGACAAAVLVPLTAPASAAVVFSSPSPYLVAEASDYASEKYRDAWDYNASSDQRPGTGTSGWTISNGLLSFTTSGSGASFEPVSTLTRAITGGYPNMPYGRDGWLQSIDTARYTRISFRMYLSAAPVDNSATVSWFTDGYKDLAHQGAFPISARTKVQGQLLKAGWNTYDFAMVNTIANKAWSGRVTGLRLLPINASGVAVKVDWIRLYQPRSAVVTSTVRGATGTVYWDRDNVLSNNTASYPAGWGLLGAYASGATVSFPISAYPPGTYRLLAGAPTSGTYSSPIYNVPLPQPVVLNPDVKGGSDWATDVRKDAWDMSQRTDTWNPVNVSGYNVANGVAYGTNATNDPQVPLRVTTSTNGGVTHIPGSAYHRLSFRLYNTAGVCNLGFEAGGGCLVRLIWQVSGYPTQVQETNDIVVYPGWNDVSVDLNTPYMREPESRQTFYGWMGRNNYNVRIDPNEDPGRRYWQIDHVQLRKDDEGNDGFTFSFQDKAWKQGTTAKIYLDTNLSTADGYREIGSMVVSAGINNWSWKMPAEIGTGLYHVLLELTDPQTKQLGRSYSSGPVYLRQLP